LREREREVFTLFSIIGQRWRFFATIVLVRTEISQPFVVLENRLDWKKCRHTIIILFRTEDIHYFPNSFALCENHPKTTNNKALPIEPNPRPRMRMRMNPTRTPSYVCISTPVLATQALTFLNVCQFPTSKVFHLSTLNNTPRLVHRQTNPVDHARLIRRQKQHRVGDIGALHVGESADGAVEGVDCHDGLVGGFVE